MTTTATSTAVLERDINDAKLVADYTARGGKRVLGYPEYGTPLYWALERDRQGKKDAARAKKKSEPVHATDLNISSLTRHIVEHAGGHVRFLNQIEAVSVPHVKRCIAAGLVRVDGRHLELTKAGYAAVRDHLQDDITRDRALMTRAPDRMDARSIRRLEQAELAAATLASESAS